MTAAPSGRARRAPAARREAVLDAARTLFIEQGVGATTMAQIADRAGVAKGTVYLYFASKDAMLGCLEAEFESDIVRRTRAWCDGHTEIADAVPAWCAGLVHAYLATRPVHDMLFLGRTPTTRAAVADNGLIDDLHTLLAENGRTHPADVAAFLVGGITVMVDRALLHDDHPDQQRLADTARRLASAVLDH